MRIRSRAQNTALLRTRAPGIRLAAFRAIRSPQMSAVTPAFHINSTPASWRLTELPPKKPEVARLCCENAVSLPKRIEVPPSNPNGPSSKAPNKKSILAHEITPHLPMLRRVAQRILRCPEQSEDAVQDAIVALWNRTERPPEMRGWLVKTVIHRSLHRRRTESRRQRWEDAAAVAATVTCPICDPEQEFAQRELLEVVQASISCLPDEYRGVIELRIQGLEYDEIARTLDLPIGTVRSRLNRGRRILRQQLAPDDV